GEEVGWAEMDLPIKGVKIGLNLNPDVEVNPANNSLVIGVLDIEETKKYIESKEVKNDDIQDIPDMISFFNCWDPFGNKIEFVGTPRVKSES
ncbi:MAG: VOC family protein, partial [Promethearchaeota archaeon]